MTIFYVGPGGSPGGDGSIGNQWDLATALAHPATVQPDDHIQIHEGRYTGNFLCFLNGTAGHPIWLEGTPGERPVIDGSLNFVFPGYPLPTGGNAPRGCTHLIVGWLRCTQTDPTRGVTGTAPNAVVTTSYPSNIIWQADDVQLRHIVYDNSAQGLAAFESNAATANLEAYGMIGYHIGVRIDVVAQGAGGGYAVYTHNDYPNITKAYRNGFFFNTCEEVFKVFSETQRLANVVVEDCVAFGGAGGTGYASGDASQGPEIIPTGTAPADYLYGGHTGNSYISGGQFNRNWACSYPSPTFTRTAVSFGGTNQSNQDMSVTGSTFLGFLSTAYFQHLAFSGNTHVSTRGLVVPGFYFNQEEFLTTPNVDQVTYPLTAYTYSTNNYYNTWDNQHSLTLGNFHEFDMAQFGWMSWDKRRLTYPAFDADSTYSAALPTANQVKVTASPYWRGNGDPIAHIGVINWSGGTTATIDVSAALVPGDTYQLWHLFDWVRWWNFEAVGPMNQGTFIGSQLTVNVAATKTPPEPIGTGQVAPAGPQASLAPLMAFYVLVKTGHGAVPTGTTGTHRWRYPYPGMKSVPTGTHP